MLYVLFMTGLMPGEIACLKVGDFLDHGRQPLGISSVRAEIAFNGRARPLYWDNPKLRASVLNYLATRPQALRDDPLFLSERSGIGFAFRETVKRGKVYRQYASVSQLYGKLFERLKVPHLSADSGRRSLAVWLFQRGADLEEIAAILGHSDLAATRLMLAGVPRVPVRTLLQGL